MQEDEPNIAAWIELIWNERSSFFNVWMAQQRSAKELKLDRLTDEALRVESEEFLGLFLEALRSDPSHSLNEPGQVPEVWTDVWRFLDSLSSSRDRRGFTPEETAMFVFSMKRPLLDLIRDHIPAPQQAEAVWWFTRLLDRLGLRTTEVYYQRRQEIIERQRIEVEELSTPVVELWDGILAMPLIGTLDTGRSQVVMETLLEAISSTGSEIAILDLTGVPTVDTQMAQHLMRTVAAARLMGAQCILSGIRPQIAQTIVYLQIELGDIRTEATLSSALREAFRLANLEIRRKGH